MGTIFTFTFWYWKIYYFEITRFIGHVPFPHIHTRALYSYLVDVIVSYDETGQVMTAYYDDGITLTRTYSQSKKTHSTCCGFSSS